MRIALVVFIIGIIAVPALADSEPIHIGGWGTLTGGVRFVDASGLNDYFGENDFDEISSWWPAYGISGYGIFAGRIVLGASAGFSRLDSSGSDADLRVIGFNGQIEAGYAVLNGPFGLLIPYGGFGGYEQSLNFDGDLRFIEIQGDDQPGDDDDLSLSRSGMHAVAGVAYYFPVKFAEGASGRYAMFMPGVRIGGTVELFGDEFQDKGGNELLDATELHYHTFFIRLEIGFGGGKGKPVQ